MDLDDSDAEQQVHEHQGDAEQQVHEHQGVVKQEVAMKDADAVIDVFDTQQQLMAIIQDVTHAVPSHRLRTKTPQSCVRYKVVYKPGCHPVKREVLVKKETGASQVAGWSDDHSCWHDSGQGNGTCPQGGACVAS